MKKKFSGLLLMLPVALTLTTALAAESSLLLNIKQFQNLAVENSRQSTIDELDIKAKETALDDVKEDANFSIGIGTTDDMYNNGITREVNTMIAESDLEYAKRVKEMNLDNIELDIYKASLKVLILEKQLDVESRKLYILNQKYDMSKARYNEGKITENDLDDVKHTLDSKSIDQEKINKDLEAANLELKRILNVEMNSTPVKVKDQLTFEKADKIDIKQVIVKALEKSSDIYKKEQDLKAKEKTMEIASKYYEEGEYRFRDSKTALEAAKLDLDDAKTNIEVQNQNKYNDILTAMDKVDLALKWEQICQKKQDDAKLKYDKGLISREDLFNAEEKLLDAQYGKFTAIHDYNAIKAEFDSLYK